jgi:hypothetical protein
VSLIEQNEVASVTSVPHAQAIWAIATAAIVQNDLCYLDSATGGIPHASPATSATAAGSSQALYVATGKAAIGGKLKLVPYRLILGVDTSAGAVGDPLYLGAAGAWSLTPGAFPRAVGTVLISDATAGKIWLAPGAPNAQAVSQVQVTDHRFFDDFDELDTDWTVTEDSAGATQAVGDALFGVVTLTNAAFTDDDACQIQYAQETFELTTGKRLFFEARVRLPVADVTNLDWFVGLAEAEDLTGVADNMPANGIGFHKEDGDLLIDASSSDGGVNLQSAALATLVTNTWVKLGLAFDGGVTGAATITPYIDGVAGTAIAAVTYATMALMSPIVMVRNGDGVATQIIEVDYFNVVQER